MTAAPPRASDAAADPAAVDAYRIDPASLEPAPSGLINRTWFARDARGEPLVLQRLHEIFPADINEDIDAVTRHLAHQGLVTPRVLRTSTGALAVRGRDGAVWRALTYVDGVSRDALESPAQAREAGAMLARFHRAVGDLAHSFKNARLGVHDTARHLGVLRAALVEHAAHREYAAVQPLAAQVLTLAERLPGLPRTPDRIVHGDPKISNVLFSRDGTRALCMIDLDTLGRMPVVLELGDALRSWCNPVAEDSQTAGFSRALFEAAIEGYAQGAGGLLQPAEWRAVPDATLTISVELAARFCADSLRERYFGWDPSRYGSASAHHQARTRNQLQVAADVLEALPQMRSATERTFRG